MEVQRGRTGLMLVESGVGVCPAGKGLLVAMAGRAGRGGAGGERSRVGHFDSYKLVEIVGNM